MIIAIHQKLYKSEKIKMKEVMKIPEFKTAKERLINTSAIKPLHYSFSPHPTE